MQFLWLAWDWRYLRLYIPRLERSSGVDSEISVWVHAPPEGPQFGLSHRACASPRVDWGCIARKPLGDAVSMARLGLALPETIHSKAGAKLRRGFGDLGVSPCSSRGPSIRTLALSLRIASCGLGVHRAKACGRCSFYG